MMFVFDTVLSSCTFVLNTDYRCRCFSSWTSNLADGRFQSAHVLLQTVYCWSGCLSLLRLCSQQTLSIQSFYHRGQHDYANTHVPSPPKICAVNCKLCWEYLRYAVTIFGSETILVLIRFHLPHFFLGLFFSICICIYQTFGIIYFIQKRKISPKRKFSAGRPCRHPAKNFGQALQVLEKTSILARTCRADVHEKTSVWKTSGWFLVPYLCSCSSGAFQKYFRMRSWGEGIVRGWNGRALDKVTEQKHRPNRRKLSKKCPKIVSSDNFRTIFRTFFRHFVRHSHFLGCRSRCPTICPLQLLWGWNSSRSWVA